MFLHLWLHFILISQFFLLNLRPANFLVQTLDVRAVQASTMFLYSQIQHLSMSWPFWFISMGRASTLVVESIKGFYMVAALLLNRSWCQDL